MKGKLPDPRCPRCRYPLSFPRCGRFFTCAFCGRQKPICVKEGNLCPMCWLILKGALTAVHERRERYAKERARKKVSEREEDGVVGEECPQP